MHGELGMPIYHMGIISMIYLGGTAMASFFSGKLLRRFRAGSCVFANMLMIAFSLLGFSLAENFMLIGLLAFPLGVGVGFADTLLNSYSALHFKARQMNWHHCFWGVGAATGPIFMAHGISVSSWRVGYQITGVVVLCIAVALLLSLPLWKKFAQASGGAIQADKTPLSYNGLFRLRGFKLSTAIFFVYNAAEATVGLWGTSYLVIARGIAPELAAGWLALYFLGITIGRLVSGFVTVLLTSRQIIWLGCALFGLGIIFLWIPIGNAAFMIGFFLMGLGCAPIFPNMVHSAPARFGAEHSQAAIGVQISSANIGATALPPLFGVIAARLGHGLFPIFLAILLGAMVSMIAALNKIKTHEQANV